MIKPLTWGYAPSTLRGAPLALRSIYMTNRLLKPIPIKEGLNMALSKVERAQIRRDMILNPLTPAHVREKLLHEERMDEDGDRRRRRSSGSRVQAQVDEYYAECAPEMSAPDVEKLRGDRSDDQIIAHYCCEAQVAVFRAVNAVVWRECCQGPAAQCVCGEPIRSVLET